jgi:glycosyltransferase involved in cell wall biosynthesis
MSLSVVVVNYNNSRFLRKAIDSVVTQSPQPAEVVVADDCSTDESCAIVAEYVRAYPFVRLIRNVSNLGPAGNRDVGIRACASTHFVTLDSDDWFESGALEAIDRRLCADGENKIVISSFRVVRDESTPLFLIDTSSYCSLANNRQLFALAARKRFMPGNQLAMATDLYRHLGGLKVSLRLYEDWEFMLRATIAGVTWAHSGVVAYSYRKSGFGVSSSAKKWAHMRNLFRVAVSSCQASGFDRYILAGFVDLVIRKGVVGLVGRRSREGFN